MNHLLVTQNSDHIVLQLNRGKANALNHEMILELRHFFNTVKTDPSCKAVLLTGKKDFFSAGIDLPEVFNYSEEKTKQFWADFLLLAIDMLEFDKPLVCAINGHAPAGGCILACCCDYRIMVVQDKYRIGLNEMAVGIAPRAGIFELYAFWIGKKVAYQALLEGKLFGVQEAKKIGLIDTLCEEDKLMSMATEKIQHYAQLPSAAFSQTKRAMRQPVAHIMKSTFEQDLDQLFQQLMSDECREIMANIVKRLTQN